ncbi:CHASE2 domain-containing protein [Iningainema tapete]|uniref:CHASE2 domain-containing protein n=1 Tax=Iningainema tapete BLCC-T55 TaxID=2748662 RepID=A0A8J6XB45_9CYAN|nr:CHASE2 domain-containing protein [Iningainema tapete]MBD2771324.1 CHASE2 domain-containing protein [Iningainema tapete BLCC-T55]
MSKRVILKLDGSLEQGFKVTLEVGEEGQVHFSETTGNLPPNPKLLQCLDLWQQNYRQILESTRITLQKVKIQTSSLSQIDTCRRFAKDLQTCFKQWLESAEFQNVEKRLREVSNQEEAIRVLIRTPDHRLHKLPWHFWEFIERYSQSEIAFSTQLGQINFSKPREKVQVLAILGNSKGIDTETDRKMLQELPNAEVTFLVEPSRQQINDLLWDRSWDIFFFAGHSETNENQGRIYINRQDSLTLDELKYSLRQAIKNGLQLAIFNSCDGLGLAYELEQLHLPQLIVMRLPVPDQIAHEFLKNFLNAFAHGDSLYVAQRKARERLQGMEDKFPCASWLPIIFQNPTVVPPTWETLSNPPKSKKFKKWRQVGALCAASVVVTGLVMGVRFLGMLEGLELPAYDQMMQMRPQEPPDDKFVIIKVTEDDFKLPEQKDRLGSLSDRGLDLVLKKLNPHEPRVIGLDIFRDFKANPKYKDLANNLRQNNFIGTCFVGDSKARIGVSPPPKFTRAQIGYADVYPDRPYNIMRRAVLAMKPELTDPCQAEYSLSFKIAQTYLKKEGIELKFTPKQYLQLGKAVFEPLENHSNGYQKLDDYGHQILINYRSVNNSPLNLTQNIFTLKQLLRDEVPLDVVKDKVVLIGVDAIGSAKDHFLTPYNQDKQELLPGVILHAQIASQIIHAALGDRPLLRVWSVETEVFWIWTWSLLGGLLVWQLRRTPVYLALAASLSLLLLYALCYTFLAYKSTWIPFVPTAIVFVVTGCCFFNYHNPKM